MQNRWKILSYPMASEQKVFDHVSQQLREAEQNSIVVLPEYVAYTEANAAKALEMLVDVCQTRQISVITTLNLVPVDLPHAASGVNYNTLTVVTKEGKVHTPQAKITPQSFERVQYQPNFPQMNVGDYEYLNRVTVEIDGEQFHVFFVICSDVYCLMAGVEKIEDIKADYCIVPGNFGNGAEQAARRTLQRFREAGIFGTTIFSNPYQVVKEGQIPLVREAVEMMTAEADSPINELTDWDRIQLVKNNVAIYPDEQVPSFVHMAKLTPMDQGRMTMGMSRFSVTVQIGIYPETIIL
ncbi:hypothetical protein [Aneurinibacillus sp. REN35]|uniref:hypothetical protein n=1 Tax=Aneurinibacillus sp. REN35 TaxID=3237286 RepID=UPI0035286514